MTAKRYGTLEYLLISFVALVLSGCATTKRDWQEANRQGTVLAYEQFLKNHPNTEEANEARRLLRELEADRENTDWSKAETANTIGDYEKFLIKHSKSKHTKRANEAIESLRFEQAKAKDEQIASYKPGVTSLDVFIADGWKSGDVVRGLVGIVAWRKHKNQEHEFILGECGNLNNPETARLLDIASGHTDRSKMERFSDVDAFWPDGFKLATKDGGLFRCRKTYHLKFVDQTLVSIQKLTDTDR